MKTRKYFQGTLFKPAQAIALLCILSFISSLNTLALNPGRTLKNRQAIQAIPNLKDGMYLIVGSFSTPENAISYSKLLKIKGKAPRIGRYEKNGHYYVYAYDTKEDLSYARQKRSELRAIHRFHNSWILYVGINLEDLEKKELSPDLLEFNLPKEPEPEVIVETEKEEILPQPPPAAEGENLHNFTFSVVSATTLKEVPGNITLIDAARNKTMKSVSTNQAHGLNAPNSQSKEMIALCEIFGYQKAQVKFKIDDPMSSEDNSFFSQSRQTTTIKFELVRQNVGDVLTMYNVYFYNNSAIMKPESKFELNSLLGMIKENEKLEIKIHGHTNGNASGKLITLKEGDLNFFEVTSNNDEKVGSAKELSKERANAIRMWLIEQGVDENRMSLKGWGGKKMLYKKNDKKASKNVRVEIEILKG
jgi:outer membrane protein OmpA-like peptidoglycan-associated protein